MSKYNYELKLKIARENEAGYRGKYLSKKYSINLSTIKNCLQQYKMFGKEGLKKYMLKANYSGEFKLSVLKYRQNYQLSYRKTAKLFNIKNSSTIVTWQKIYLERGFEGLCGTVGRPKKNGASHMPKENNKVKN